MALAGQETVGRRAEDHVALQVGQTLIRSTHITYLQLEKTRN